MLIYTMILKKIIENINCQTKTNDEISNLMTKCFNNGEVSALDLLHKMTSEQKKDFFQKIVQYGTNNHNIVLL